MKKILVLIGCFVILGSFSTAFAASIDWSIAKGGASGYLSSTSPVAVFFYAKQGDSVTIVNFNSSTVSAICGVASVDNSANIIAMATDGVVFTASASTLYIGACVYKSGTAGNAVIGAIDTKGLASLRKTERETEFDEIEKEELANAIKGILENRK